MNERLHKIMLKAAAMSMVENASDGDVGKMREMIKDKAEEAIGMSALRVAGEAAELIDESGLEIDILMNAAVLLAREGITRGLALHDTDNPEVTEAYLAKFVNDCADFVKRSVDLQLADGMTFTDAAKDARKRIEDDIAEAEKNAES